MKYHTAAISDIAKSFNGSETRGLTESQAVENRKKYGENKMSKTKKRGFFARLFSALSEPTLIILEFAWVITVGINVGKFLKSGVCDVYECIGIFVAIFLSVALTMFMEGRSEKAFEMLGATYDRLSVKVIRGGEVKVVPKEEIVAGDLILLETGDKIIADGRLIESAGLCVDESTLTGESLPVKKDKNAIADKNATLAERKNMAYSGTFVSSGTGKMLVTAVGDDAELGKIAKNLGDEARVSAPLNEKLGRLGKKITIIGSVAAACAFILSVIRLALSGNFNFFSVQDCFVEAIVLIVAAVPEGLPTTAAISLTLNVLKLAKSNALIRKLVAAETVGCVSVICSDKTGTLTENKISVEKIFAPDAHSQKAVYINSAVNSTAELKRENGRTTFFGSATECALLTEAEKRGYNYKTLRSAQKTDKVVPFNSAYKFMSVEYGGVTYLKGAPEVVLTKCKIIDKRSIDYLKAIEKCQKDGKRVIAFASGNDEFSLKFDGYAVISDPVRKGVAAAVDECFKAGIRVIMMTGDNAATATAVAAQLNLLGGGAKVANASELDALSLTQLKKELKTVAVIARSTPQTKLRVVDALKSGGEVVAVTGDGVNDAPAIKHADVGIAMGSGSEITKEASDVVLLDDSFSTIVKAVSFGRNVYRNFQRFITFQLTVNVTSMLVVIISLLIGRQNPFNAVQLLWIDIIMDGPPALTLALETGDKSVMREKPVRRTDEVLTFKMLVKIALHGVYAAAVLIAQYKFDFLCVGSQKVLTSVFCLFVTFQLINAFNCRKIGSESVFRGFLSNKLMVVTFAATFAFQIIITQFFGEFFKIIPLCAADWLKIAATAFTVLIFSELYKLVYRCAKKGGKNYSQRTVKAN